MQYQARGIIEPRHVISNNVADEPVQPPFKLKTPNGVQPVA